MKRKKLYMGWTNNVGTLGIMNVPHRKAPAFYIQKRGSTTALVVGYLSEATKLEEFLKRFFTGGKK